jgi:hypothetical protein
MSVRDDAENDFCWMGHERSLRARQTRDPRLRSDWQPRSAAPREFATGDLACLTQIEFYSRRRSGAAPMGELSDWRPRLNGPRSQLMRVAALDLVLLLVSGAVAGQNTGSGNSAAQSAGNSNAQTVQTVRGCLFKTGNTYVSWGHANPTISDCWRGHRRPQTQARPHRGNNGTGWGERIRSESQWHVRRRLDDWRRV